MRFSRLPVLLACVAGAMPLLASQVRADTPDEQLAAASALYDAKKYDSAAAILDGFLSKNPKHAKAGQAAYVLGRCRSELKQYPAALGAYSRAVASKDAAVLTEAELGMGEAAMQTEQYAVAVDALQSALKDKLKPAQAQIAWFWLGNANFNLKRYGPAREAYDHVASDYSASDLAPTALGNAALALYRDQKPDEAAQRYRILVEKYPRSKERGAALLFIAQSDLGHKNYPAAQQEFQTLLNDRAVREGDKSLRDNAEDGLIQTLLEQQNYKQAAPLLEVALGRLGQDDPQRYRAALTLGGARYHEKEYDRALAAYQIAANSKESAVAAQGLYWSGNAQMGLNRPAEGAAQFALVTSRFPNDKLASKAQLRAGDALTEAKQIKEASSAYQVVIDKYPQSPEAAVARQNLTGLVGALDDPMQILAAVKNAPPADKNAAMLRAARIYLSGKKVTEAQSVLNDVAKASPTGEVGAEAQYLLGLSYDSQQKPQPAAAALAQATALSPHAVWAIDAQTRLAELYLDLKQPDKAEKAASSALDLKPDAVAAQQIRLTQAQAQIDQKKWDDAFNTSQALQSSLAAHPSPNIAATALYMQAWVRDQQNKPDDALPLWERLTREYPKSDYVPTALLRQGDARMKAEKYAEAQEKYTQLINDYPKSDLVAQSRFKRGSALFNLGKTDEAAADFGAVGDDKMAGGYQSEGLYWAGVALDKAGKKADAITRLTALVTQYPTTAHVPNAKIRLAALKAVAN